MNKILIATALLTSAPAYAQSSQSPLEQAMGAKLLTEISAGLQCAATDIATKAALDRALARIKELEAKTPELHSEPKESP